MAADKRRARTLLVIAHEFPPVGGASVLRISKLTRYLPEFGWRAAVVTARPGDIGHDAPPLQDEALWRSVRDQVDIHPGASPVERIVRTLGRRYVGQPLQLASGTAGAAGAGRTGPASALKRAAGRVYVFQDESGLWAPFAARDAIAIARAHGADAVLTTSPPHLVQLAGLAVRRATGLPWIADFRDGWTDNFVFRSRSRRRRLVDHLIERTVLHAADAKLVVTEAMLRSFRGSYPQLADSFHLLRNGYDPQDFDGPSATLAYPVVFRHLGSIGGPRDPALLLAAFRQVYTSGVIAREQLAIEFIGAINALDPATLPQVGATFLPPVAHHRATRLMAEAGVLVLLAGAQYGESAFASKVYEYIAARRPILAVMPLKSELAALLRDYPRCVIAAPDDLGQIAQAIARSYRLAQDETLHQRCDEAWIEQFSRRQQAQDLVRLLNQLCAASERRHARDNDG